MEVFKKTKKLFITFLIVCVLGLAFDITVFFVIKRRTEAVSIAENQLALAAEKANSLKSVKVLMDDTAERRVKVDTFFIKDDKVVDFLDSLDTLGTKNGVKLTINSVGVAPLTKPSSSFLEQLNIKIQVEGSWANVYRFLTLLETMPYKVSWGRVGFDKVSGRDSKQSVWQGVFDVSIVKLK